MAGNRANADSEKPQYAPNRSTWLRLAGWILGIVGAGLLYLTWFAWNWWYATLVDRRNITWERIRADGGPGEMIFVGLLGLAPGIIFVRAFRIAFFAVVLVAAGGDCQRLAGNEYGNVAGQVWYGGSDDYLCLARVTRDDTENGGCRAVVMRYSPNRQRYELVAEVRLANEYRPLETFVSPDGRYLITTGNVAPGGETAAAVGIYDLQGGTRRVFDLKDLLASRELLERHCDGLPAYQKWFRPTYVSIGVPNRVWDEEKQVLYLAGYDNGNPPVIPIYEIDPRRQSFGFANRNPVLQALADAQATWDKYEENELAVLGTAMEGAFWQAIRQVVSPPAVRIKWAAGGRTEGIGGEFLYRLQPGDWHAPPVLTQFRYIEDEKSLVAITAITLRNPVAPNGFTFTPDHRYVVTYDEYDSIGRSENTVVIYDLVTGISKNFGLEDFCPPEDLEKLAKSRNVRMWRVWRFHLDSFDPDRYEFLAGGSFGHTPTFAINPAKMTVQRTSRPFNPPVSDKAPGEGK